MPRQDLYEEDLTRSVIGAFYHVYNQLGYGFLEHIYVKALERELRKRGHQVSREFAVRVFFDGEDLGVQRLDMVIDNKLVVETKSTAQLRKSDKRQVYNYLRATNLEVGLLLHFGPEPQFFRLFCHNRSKIIAPGSDQTVSDSSSSH